MGQQLPGAPGADDQPEDAADDGGALRADTLAARSARAGEEQERAGGGERDGEAVGDRPGWVSRITHQDTKRKISEVLGVLVSWWLKGSDDRRGYETGNARGAAYD